MAGNVYTVGQVNAYIRNMFTQDFMLNRIYVKGEVSNCKYHTSGHIYFSLKDESGTIACVMFAGQRSGLSFRMSEGQQVIVLGSVSVYERNGTYQLYAKEIRLDGEGVLYERFQALKKELEEMGMFAEEYKKPIPPFAMRIGVVTASTGAAIRDIMNISSRRNPYVQLLLYPAQVQGEGAAESIVKGISVLEKAGVDVMIVGRGGGSIEDLWAFNEEIVVQAIFESRLPVISSVGHETDTTLADYVADRRAATPTAAAELATPVTKADIISWIAERDNRIYQAALRRIKQSQERLDKLANSVIFRQPERLYDGYVQKLDRLVMSLINSMQNQFSQAKQRQELLHQRLLALDFDSQIKHYKDNLQSLRRLLLSNMTSQYDSKLARFEKAQDALLSLDTSRIIARGYAMVQKDDKVISSVTDVNLGDKLTVQLKDGQLEVEVKDAK